MKVLVVYELPSKTDRNTIFEHLNSFKTYAPEHEFHYVNIFKAIPFYLTFIKYDLIIFHYTFLAGSRFLNKEDKWKKKTRRAKRLSGYKVAIPQDEYDHTNRLNDFFKEANVETVCTCFTLEADINKAYGNSGVKRFLKVFTGYVEDSKIDEIKELTKPFKDRPIDIGYRARHLPAYFGKHGQLKYELVEIFSSALKDSHLNIDILNTNDASQKENSQAVKKGNSWYDFLLSCKSFIGCEGGSSLLDPDGSIKQKVLEYNKIHPNANFDEIENACFKGLDYNISCFALSPRHFEAALCKTLQILVEGSYSGVFLPWKHYIPLKRDYSNMSEVIETLQNEELCQSIINKAYEDIVLSGEYSYKKFVSSIISHAVSNIQFKESGAGLRFHTIGRFLIFRNENYWRIAYVKNIIWKVYFWVRSRTWAVMSFFYVLFFAATVRKIKKNIFKIPPKNHV